MQTFVISVMMHNVFNDVAKFKRKKHERERERKKNNPERHMAIANVYVFRMLRVAQLKYCEPPILFHSFIRLHEIDH